MLRPHLYKIAALTALLFAGNTFAQTTLSAILTNGQENPPTVPTMASGGARPASFGTASFVINAAQTSMTFTATITNIDFTGQQTADPNDDLKNAHIHASATVTPTTNGPVVWGFFGAPYNDNNPNDVVIIPLMSVTPFAPPAVGGTISGKWDAPEGNATTLAAQLPNILAGRAYINFHTTQFGGGEIRGNLTLAPNITTNSGLPPATLNTAYTQTLAANGGATPYTWSVVSGTLPAGLSLSSDGVISGTPTAAGTSTFTVNVTGSAASFASKTFNLAVVPPLDFTSALRVAHVVDAAGFVTQFAIANLETTAVNFQFKFWGDSGNVMNFPILNGTPGSLAGTLAPGATVFAQTAGTSSPLAQGWAEVASSGRVSVLANYFRTGVPSNADSEASVLGTRSGNSIQLPFDNTQGFITGVALSNTNAFQTLVITVTASAEAGAPSTSTTISLPPHGHTSFLLTSQLAATAGQRGSLRFTANSPDIAAVGLRFGPRNSFTSLGSFQ